MLQFDKDQASSHAALFDAVRQVVLASSHDMVELRKPRITTFQTPRGGVCHVRTRPYGVDVGFLQGARMTDPEGLLSGRGKLIRVLEVRELQRTELQFFLGQALDLLQAQ
ncbi:MAG: DUF1801 domain-containing protein [Pseudomonadota bacterium]